MRHPIIIDSHGSISKYGGGIIAKYLSTLAGRQKLASAMVSSLRTNIDYQSIGRKTFIIEQLPAGALPIYDRDVCVSNIICNNTYKHRELIINSSGKIQRNSSKIKGIRVSVPTFQICSNPIIKINDVKIRRSNMLE